MTLLETGTLRAWNGLVAARGIAKVVSNYLIQKLPPDSQERLLKHSELVELRPRQILIHRGVPQTGVFFLESGAVLTEAKVDALKFGGFGLTGKAGLVGLSSVLGASDGLFRAAVVCEGHAYRIRPAQLAALARDDEKIGDVLLRFAHVRLVLAGQIAACNAWHSAAERLSRWLLTACYMTGSSELCLSQSAVAGPLGIRRPTVTECLGSWKEAGLIGLQRGKISILNLEQFEAISCRCHKPIRREIRAIAPPDELARHAALLSHRQRAPIHA